MKNIRGNERTHSKQQVNIPRPENKDNLDSRETKEDNYKDNNNRRGRKPNTKDKNEAGH